MNLIQSPNGIRKVVHWLRPRVRTIPVLGQAARYVKRLIVMPWNFHKQYQQSQTVQAETRGTFQSVQRVEGQLDALNVAMARIATQFSEADRQRQATHRTVIETAKSIQVEAADHAATIEILFAAVVDRLSTMEHRLGDLATVQATAADLVQQVTAIRERTSVLPDQIAGIGQRIDVVSQQQLALADVPNRLETLSERLTAQTLPIADTATRLDALTALPSRIEDISMAVAQLGPRIANAEMQIAESTTRAESEARRFQNSVDERLDVLVDKFDSSIRLLSADVRGMNERHAAAFDLVSERLRDQTVRLLGMGEDHGQGGGPASFASEQIADLVTGQLELARQIADLKQLVGGRNDGAVGNLRLRA